MTSHLLHNSPASAQVFLLATSSVLDKQMHQTMLQMCAAPICAAHHTSQVQILASVVQWSEDVIKADPFFGRSRVRFRLPPWVSNTIARDHLA